MNSHQQGLAGEYLVAADICRQGYLAHLAAAGSKCDILLEVADKVLRVQVKSCYSATLQPGHARPTYFFRLYRQEIGKKPITTETADLLALVAVDTGHVAYLPVKDCTTQVIKIRPSGSEDTAWTKKQNKFDQLTLEKALKEIL